MVKKTSLALGVMFSLAGCNMSGLDAKSKFACKAPDGVLCESMSGVYANAQARNLPSQRVNAQVESDTLSHAKVDAAVMTKPINSGAPIRSAPRLLRVWFAPWEDTDGDLHDQSYVYLPVDSGRWLIEHNRRRIQDTYRPVRAPSAETQKITAQATQKVSEPIPQSQNSPASVDGQETIGVRQDRISPEQATQFLNGIMMPGNNGMGAE